MKNGRYFAVFLPLPAVFIALAISGCEAEKQYPGGDNDDRRKPAAAASTVAPAVSTSRDKPGSNNAGDK